jgi:uncharacterized protein YrrD
MIKFASDIIGSVVILFQERAKVGEIKELIINPEKGSLLGFVVYQYSGDDKVILLRNVKGFGSGVIVIDEYSSLSDIEDIVEIKKIYPKNPEIIKSRVYTESGQRLGKVHDVTVNLEGKKIENLYVEPTLGLKILSSQLIISEKKIVKIEKNKIIVSDGVVSIKDKKIATVEAAILD